MVEFRNPIRGWELIALIAILTAAMTLRVWRLGSVPPGLTHDEASNGHDAAAVLHGTRPIYFTVGYGHEPLYPYSVALVMSVLGPTKTALRLTTVLWGSALILLSYFFARRLFGWLPALLTGVWMAISFWCLMTSRVGLRGITAAVTFAASAYSFWRAIMPQPTPGDKGSVKRYSWLAVHNWTWGILSGISLGVSIYTYMASRAMPAVYLLFLAYVFASSLRPAGRVGKEQNDLQDARQDRTSLRQQRLRTPQALREKMPPFRQLWFGIAVLLLTAAIVAAPLVHFLVTNPEAEQRIGQLSAPLKDALQGNLGSLWNRIVRSLPMFTFHGDPLWLYNIPGRPLLDVASGPFFYAGLLVCLWHWRDPRHVFLLLWLVVGTIPALVTGPDATALRSIVAQPAIFITTALGLATVARFLYQQTSRWGRMATVGAVTALVIVTGARTAHDYFNVWAQHRDVRVAYHHALVEQAHYLDTHPENNLVALSSIYPDRFHDPYTMEIALRRQDLSLRWFDGRFALLFPAEDNTRVIIPSITPLDEIFSPAFESHASHLDTERFRSDDLITHFDVYRFDSDDALQSLLQTMRANPVYSSDLDAFQTDDPRSECRPLDLPLTVGGVVDLVGYDLRSSAVEPGKEMELLTVWQVRDTFTLEAVAFTHVLDHKGRVIAQLDRLDVPSWHWRPGDAFVQLHRFPIDAETPPGLYPVEIGLYVRESSKRLPVTVDGSTVDDRILLRPLEVATE